MPSATSSGFVSGTLLEETVLFSKLQDVCLSAVRSRNYYAPTLTLAPLTSKTEKKKSQPTHYLLRKAKGLQRPSTVLAEQLGTFDKTCIIRYLGRVSGGQMRGIDEAVKVQLGYYIPEKCSRDGHFRQGKYYDHKEETHNEGTSGGTT